MAFDRHILRAPIGDAQIEIAYLGILQFLGCFNSWDPSRFEGLLALKIEGFSGSFKCLS
jgi:hypothetical protein